jgi:AcrR family transcriptional regulator
VTQCHPEEGLMPKNTFYKINIEKRKKIIEVGEILFSQNIYEDVDVKMIVEASKIPRGSFYAYFDNLQDYYLTIVKSLQEDRIEEVRKIKTSSELSLFQVLLKLFENDIKKSHNSDKKLLIRHYFRYTLTQKLGFHEFNLEKKDRPIFEVLNSFQKNYNLEDSRWEDFLDLCMNTYLLTYMRTIDKTLNIQESIELFKNRIEILERGIK